MFSCRLKIARGVIVGKLFIKVNSSDSSYMPERVIVAGCYSSPGKQHVLKETTIPSYDRILLFSTMVLQDILLHRNANNPSLNVVRLLVSYSVAVCKISAVTCAFIAISDYRWTASQAKEIIH